MSGDRITYRRAILVWPFADAPLELQRLARRPGTWVVVVPGDHPAPAWCVRGSSPDFAELEIRGLTDGDTCYIGFTALPRSTP